MLNKIWRTGKQLAEKFLREKGVETLFTLGTALLTSESIQMQKKRLAAQGQLMVDTVVPAGTVLGFVDLYPNFADQLSPGQHTRLSRVASTFMRWRFDGESCVNFEPAAGALINGQIGLFVTSDPRYELTATGQDAVRLIREFQGVITQISQRACLPVPTKRDWLYVEDAHESDIRLTRQGTLWVLAATDISFDPTSLTALGEFNLDYDVQLKDNSLDGAVIIPETTIPITVIRSIPSTVGETGLGTSTSYTFTPGHSTATGNFAICQPIGVDFDTSLGGISTLLTPGATTKFTFRDAGYYRIVYNWSLSPTYAATPPTSSIAVSHIHNLVQGTEIANYSGTVSPIALANSTNVNCAVTAYANIAAGDQIEVYTVLISTTAVVISTIGFGTLNLSFENLFPNPDLPALSVLRDTTRFDKKIEKLSKNRFPKECKEHPIVSTRSPTPEKSRVKWVMMDDEQN